MRNLCDTAARDGWGVRYCPYTWVGFFATLPAGTVADGRMCGANGERSVRERIGMAAAHEGAMDRLGHRPARRAAARCSRAAARMPGRRGVKVIITPAPPTPTSVARSLTPPPTLSASTRRHLPANAPTITGAVASQLAAGAKAKVKDSADGLVLRESPSTKAKPVESLAAGAVLSVLADPQDAEGRTWVKVSHGNFQGYVAAEFVQRTDA